MKTCTNCAERKPVTEFGRHARKPDGLRARCKECERVPPRELQCQSCGGIWLYRNHGPEAKLCPTCSEFLGWCRSCGPKPQGEFHRQNTIRKGFGTICKPCTRERNRTTGYRARRNQQLKSAYGITIVEYESMIERQAGKCACCSDSLGERPVVDHCHETGVVRGLLCVRCNTGLGHIGDNAEGAHMAEVYLWKSRDLLGELAAGRHTIAEALGAA